IVVAAPKSFAEVVAVVGQIHVAAGVAVRRLAILGRVRVVRAPMVGSVSGSGAIAAPIPVVHGLPEQIGAVLIGLMVCSTELVAKRRRSHDVRFGLVPALGLEIFALLRELLRVLLLSAVLRHAMRLLQLGGLLLGNPNLFVEVLAVIVGATLLVGD